MLSKIKIREELASDSLQIKAILVDCLLLGALAVDKKYQDKGVGKKLNKIWLKLARSRNKKICFISGEFDFDRMCSKKLNLITLDSLTYDSLLICELTNDALNLLQNNSKMLPSH